MFDIDYIKSVLGVVAGVIAYGAYGIYIVSIIKGETKPNRATWWIWSIMGFIIAFSYSFTGAQNTLWSAYAEFLGPFSIALLSLKYGEGGFNSRTDTICILGALLCIVLWFLFDNPVLVLITAIIVDTFAIIPTILKSYHRPEDEDFTSWSTTLISDIINILAIESFIFGVIIYPIYMFSMTAIIVGVLLKKNILIKFKRVPHENEN